MTDANPTSRLVLPVGSRDHVQGLVAAPFTLVEYGDYQCPACKEAHRTVQALQQQLGDRLRFVFRHFPQEIIHSEALHAAEAAEAAATQGQFWKMHNTLFENQQELGNGFLMEYALAIGLQINRFLAEMTEDTHVERVREDYDGGVRSGVICTPTFFINDLRYNGDWDETTLMTAILSVSL
jgi:protein-disulfide isomerase